MSNIFTFEKKSNQLFNNVNLTLLLPVCDNYLVTIHFKIHKAFKIEIKKFLPK